MCLSVIENRKSTPKTDHVKINEKVFPWHPPPNHSGGKTCPPTQANKPLFRTQEIVRSPYAIALALFFAVRSRSPSRTFCSSSLLILPYGLPAPTVLAPDVFLPDGGVAFPPPPATILPARSDQSGFPSLHTSSQTSPISSTYCHTNVPSNLKCTWIYACAKL